MKTNFATLKRILANLERERVRTNHSPEVTKEIQDEIAELKSAIDKLKGLEYFNNLLESLKA